MAGELSYTFINALVIVLAFLVYFVGVMIRWVVLEDKEPVPLSRQLLVGIPTSVAVVSPLTIVLNVLLDRLELAHILAVIGIILEHGMFVHHEAMHLLSGLLKKPSKAVMDPTS